MSAGEHFSQSYAEARAKFLEAAEAAGLDVQSHPHPMLGRDAEPLAMDVVRDGPADAAALLIVSSGCHGVEGFCGSGVQTALLRDAAWRAAVAASGVALLYIHALNPYGFSWWRRTTHENVDLNRNFHDFAAAALPRNDGYDELAAAIVPAHWPPPPEAQAALQRYAQAHGAAKLQQAISGGQYRHEQGLFYGGRNPTWSHVTLRHVLQEHVTRCARLGWIDLHTGLGPSGVGERIFACRDDAAALARARAWWGDKVTSIYDGSSTSAPLEGLMWLSAYQEAPRAEYTGIALEYGTWPLERMIDALRADQWLENHPEAPEALRAQIKQRTRDAFYIDTDAWKQRVVEQALDAAHGALRGLSVR
ncbi:MAG TPA: M14 family metallopeptidase [Burkholderiaceae bacterium]|nr:M14 family metallopeptidase [Burkholderiaceae bacterium]